MNLARGFRGGERQTELLIREFANQGKDQCLVARAGEPLLERVSDLQSVQLRPVRGRLHALAAISGSRIVHAHEAKAAQVAYLNYCLRRTPYVITRRVDRPPRRAPFSLNINRSAAAVIALSNAIRDILQATDPDLAVDIIPSAGSGLATDKGTLSELKARYSGCFVIGHVGALVDRHKGQSTLIDSVRLLGDLEDLRVLLVGDGEDRDRFQRAAQGLPVDFAGHVTDVGSYLATMRIFVFPSNNEGLGSILIDAMAFGLPVIATAVGGIPELVEDGVNGLLVDPGRPDALADAIRRLYQDPTLCNAMGQRNAALAQQFSPAVMAGRYAEIYRRVCNEF